MIRQTLSSPSSSLSSPPSLPSSSPTPQTNPERAVIILVDSLVQCTTTTGRRIYQLRRNRKMKYCSQFYTDQLRRGVRGILMWMTSAPAAFAVIFTSIYSTKMLQWFGVDQHIIDLIFLPCGIYFLWCFMISFIDYNIEKDVL